ncbi:MAG: hypothetical protein M0P69_21280, partial [Bacteroidales bacterium]|nr:hypothetical protein [Bacteroidales bacterium]
GSTLSDEELSFFALRVNKINEELGTLKNKFEFRLQPDTTFRGGFAYLGSAPSEESFDEEETALKQRLASLISQEEYITKYGRGNSFNYLSDEHKERSFQFRRRNQQEIIKLQGQLDILASKKQKFTEYSESPYDKELRELQTQRDSIDNEISDIRSSPFLPGESRNRRNARINSSYMSLTGEKEEINRKIHFLTLENDPVGNNTRPEELRHSETLPLTGFAVNEGEIGGSTSHGNRVFANRETSINKFGVAFDKLSAYAKLQEDIIAKMKNNLKVMLPVIGVSLAAAALGAIFGAPELGAAAPLMFAGLMKPQRASEKLEAEGKKVYWDIDGTYLYNFLDQKFDEHTKLLGLDNFKTYNRANPLVNPADIQNVITARPEKYRDATLADLARAGVFPKELLMRGDDSWDKEGSSQFKARALKEHGATHYVDDDMAYNAMLAPLLGGAISAISTNDFYNMAGQLSQRTDSFMNIGKLETSSVLDMLKQTLNSPKGKQLLRAALPIVLAGAFSAVSGISPDIAAMGAMPVAFMGITSSDDTENLRAQYKQQLNDIATIKGDLQRERKLPGISPFRVSDIDAELGGLDFERNRIGGLLGALSPESKAASSETHASLLDYLPFQEGNNAYRFYASLGYDLKGSSKGQSGFPKEVEDIKSRYISGASELSFFKQNPEQLKNLSAMINTITDFNDPAYGGTLKGTVNLAASLDLGKDATQNMVDEIDRYNKGFVQASGSTNKFGESILMTKDSVESTGKEINALTKYSKQIGKLSWSFTMLSMNALGVFFSMMSINNMLMQGVNMVLTPLTDLDKMMQSYALSTAFASKTGIDMTEAMKRAGVDLKDVTDGWETMTGFISNIQWGLGIFGAGLLKDEDTFKSIQSVVQSIVDWLSNPTNIDQVGKVITQMADVIPQLLDMMPTILTFLDYLTKPFNPNAKEDDWLGNQSVFSLMLYGQIGSMFAMPILS